MVYTLQQLDCYELASKAQGKEKQLEDINLELIFALFVQSCCSQVGVYFYPCTKGKVVCVLLVSLYHVKGTTFQVQVSRAVHFLKSVFICPCL